MEDKKDLDKHKQPLHSIIADSKRSFLLFSGNGVQIVDDKNIGIHLSDLVDSKGNIEQQKIIKFFKPFIIQKSHKQINSSASSIQNKAFSFSSKKLTMEWHKDQKLAFVLFSSKLKEALLYCNPFNSMRIFNWLLYYIKKMYPKSVLTRKILVKQLHQSRSKQQKQSQLDDMVGKIKQSLGINGQEFKQYLQKFEQQFPQVEAVLEYYSLNTSTQTYKSNCIKAQNFLKKFINDQVSNRSKQRTEQWTRYQYLTYIAFLQTKQEKSLDINKQDFVYLAQYSFQSKFRILWLKHLSFTHQKKNIKNLTNQWNFTEEMIRKEKNKIQSFLKQVKNQHILINFSSFQQFLAQKKTILIKNPIRIIIADNIELFSKQVQCFVFSKPDQKDNVQKKSKKTKCHYVYLRAKFQINQIIKVQIEKIGKKLISINSNSKYHKTEQMIESEKIDSFLSQNEQTIMKLDKGSEKSFSLSHLEDKYQQEFFKADSDIQIIKNSIECNSQKNDLISELESLQLWQQPSSQKPKSEDPFDVKQDFFAQDERNNFELFNSPFKQKEIFFSSSFQNRQINAGLVDYKRKAQASNHALAPISQEDSNLRQLNKEENNKESINNNQSLQRADHLMSQKSPALSTQQFLETLVSKQQYLILKDIFQRKIQQQRLMSLIANSNYEKKRQHERQQFKDTWLPNQNIRFVSFIILNKFVFIKKMHFQTTFRIMSEFMVTKTRIQCKNHFWFHITKNKPKLDEAIIKYIQKLKLPIIKIKHEILRLKQQLLQGKTQQIFIFKNREFVTLNNHQTNQSKQTTNLIVEHFERNPLTFNMKEDYLHNNHNNNEVQKGVNFIQKERYLHCLEKIYQKQKNVSLKKIIPFATQIFRERQTPQNQKQALVEKYHKMMIKKHKHGRKIIEKEKEWQKGVENKRRKGKTQNELENNIRFSEMFCKKCKNHKIGEQFQLQFLKYMFEQHQKSTCDARAHKGVREEQEDKVQQSNNYFDF